MYFTYHSKLKHSCNVSLTCYANIFWGLYKSELQQILQTVAKVWIAQIIKYCEKNNDEKKNAFKEMLQECFSCSSSFSFLQLHLSLHLFLFHFLLIVSFPPSVSFLIIQHLRFIIQKLSPLPTATSLFNLNRCTVRHALVAINQMSLLANLSRWSHFFT